MWKRKDIIFNNYVKPEISPYEKRLNNIPFPKRGIGDPLVASCFAEKLGRRFKPQPFFWSSLIMFDLAIGTISVTVWNTGWRKHWPNGSKIKQPETEDSPHLCFGNLQQNNRAIRRKLKKTQRLYKLSTVKIMICLLKGMKKKRSYGKVNSIIHVSK